MSNFYLNIKEYFRDLVNTIFDTKTILLDNNSTGRLYSTSSYTALTGDLTLNLYEAIPNGFATILWNGSSNPNINIINGNGESVVFNNTISTTGDYVITLVYRFNRIEVFIPAASSGGTTPGDTTAPTVVSATVENATPTTLTVVMSEAVTISDATGLSLDGPWAGYTLTYVSGSGTTTLVLTIGTAIANGESGNFVYGATNNIADTATTPNELVAGSTAVTNNVSGSSIITFQDSFAGTTIAADWTKKDSAPTFMTTTQNGEIIQECLATHSGVVGEAQLVKNVGYDITTDFVVSFDLQVDNQAVAAGFLVGMHKGNDPNATLTNRFFFQSAVTATEVNATYHDGSAPDNTTVVLDLTTYKTLKIICIGGNVIFKYWNGTAWVTMKTVTAHGETGTFYLALASRVYTGSVVGNQIKLDNVRISSADFSTQYPV